MENPLLKISEQNKSDKPGGIFSICTSNKYVIEAAMRKAKEKGTVLLVEPTSNQVNQYGGYSSMNAEQFVQYIKTLSEKNDFAFEDILLGGDHLGPLPWANESADSAMQKAEDLVRSFVSSGFTKIHIDTTMKLSDDSRDEPIDLKIIAQRAAKLIITAKTAFIERKKIIPEATEPVYVIGSEVPTAGGAKNKEVMKITSAEELKNTITTFKVEFEKQDLLEEFNRIIAIVVQPGVEFTNNSIYQYDRNKAKSLIESISEFPNLVFEGHSTDYQTKQKLKEMIEDKIAILKVGPALTYFFKRSIFCLESIEKELIQKEDLSNFSETLNEAMGKNTIYWENHYSEEKEAPDALKKYSFLDRSRYYFIRGEVPEALKKLISNLKNVEIPLPLLAFYFPQEYHKIQNGDMENDPEEILISGFSRIIEDYYFAVGEENMRNLKC